MSQLSSTGLYDEESESADSGETQDIECSLSSTTVVSSTVKTEKSLEGSTSLETAWTDSKHSSYLDFMEASFVQNMFARSYCMEDVCGETPQHHHHHHHHHHHRHHYHYHRLTNFEESNSDSAESRLHSHETLECEMYDNGDWTSEPATKRAKAPTGIPWVLLENPWVKHFRPRHSSSASSKTSILLTRTAEKAKRDVQSTQETASTVINSHDHHQNTSDSMSDSEKGKKRITPSRKIIHLKATSSRRIIHLKAGEMKASILNASSNGMLDRNSSRNKRRVLWSFYREVHRIRQKTGNYVQGGNTFNQDGAAPPNLSFD